jgi:hypothetical protein
MIAVLKGDRIFHDEKPAEWKLLFLFRDMHLNRFECIYTYQKGLIVEGSSGDETSSETSP